MAVWYKGSDGTDHYGTPSNSSEKASVATSTQPTGSLATTSGSKSSSLNSGGSSNNNSATYTPYLEGESDYARTARALNNYATSGNLGAYNNAVAYAQSQGWGDMVPSILPSALKADKADTTTQTATPSIIPTANQDLMKTLLATLPTYNYQPQEYQQTIPDYSITKNPNDTTFIPTVKSKQLWNETQNQNADNAYKTYSTQMANYTQAYQQIQDQIANALQEKTLENQTIKQRADEAQAKQDQEYKNALLANDTAKTQAQIDGYNNKSTGSSGESGWTGASAKGNTSNGEYTFNVDRGLAATNAIGTGKTTLASVDYELAQRYKYGQLTAEEYNQWMYYLHPDQVGQQQTSPPSYSGSALQTLLKNR